MQKRQNLEFINQLEFLSHWERLKRYNFNDIIDTKLLNHEDKIYLQGDKAPQHNGPCKCGHLITLTF